MKIIPAIDIIDGKCVRLTQGDYAQKKIYSENPAEVAGTYAAAGLTHLHLVDLDGAKAGKVVNWKVIKEITSQTDLAIDVGGGIKTEGEVVRLFDLGVTQVNLGSIAVKNPQLVYSWIEKFGSEKIILSADVKNEQVQISGWQENAVVNILNFIKSFQTHGMEYVTCTDISTDGMLSGPNIILYKKLLDAFPGLKLIASGGVSSVADIQALKKINTYGVIVGKAIYENKISLAELRAENGPE
jgi:phosphoribosylformimino-5-aminoimidazole carboxamide ribotide isomerase